MINGTTDETINSQSTTSDTQSSSQLDLAALTRDLDALLSKSPCTSTSKPSIHISPKQKTTILQNFANEEIKMRRFLRLHNILVQSANPDSEYYQWVVTWEHAGKMEEYTKGLFDVLKNADNSKSKGRGKHNKSRLDALIDAIQWLPKDEKHTLQFLNINTDVKKYIWEHLDFLEEVNQAFDARPEQGAVATQRGTFP